MKLQSFMKLDLLAAAQENKLLESLVQHHKALQRCIEQQTLLNAYQERLTASWRNGTMVCAGDALRASKFVAQADAAYQHLIDSIKAEQEKKTTCEVSLAALRIRRKTLQQRLIVAKQDEENKVLKKVEQATSFYRISSVSHPSFFLRS